MEMSFYNEIPTSTQRVFLRTDYNVPLKKGVVQDPYRIQKSKKTIQTLLDKGIKQIIIGTHIGRPDGREEVLSTKHIQQTIEEEIGIDVHHIEKLPPEKEDLPSPTEARLVLLENLRFHSEEIYNETEYAKNLAKLADVYVNDAFGVSHRKHASVHAIKQYIPSYYGSLIKKELDVVNELQNTTKEIHVVLGGAKLPSKLPVIQEMLNKAQKVYIAGTMMFPFYALKGYTTGRTNVEEKSKETAKKVADNPKIVLPEDVVVANNRENPTRIKNVAANEIPDNMEALDIGTQAVKKIKESLETAEYVVWNGPLGYYENSVFAKSTNELLRHLEKHPAKTIIGGGDTGNAVHKTSSDKNYYHVSTGGGAFLKLLETGTLPALQ